MRCGAELAWSAFELDEFDHDDSSFDDQSPTLRPLSVACEECQGEHFGHVIGILEVRGALEDFEHLLVDEIPKPVPLAQEVLGAICDSMVGGQAVGSLVVLEHTRVHCRSLQFLAPCMADHLVEDALERDESLEGTGECRVLCFERGHLLR